MNRLRSSDLTPTAALPRSLRPRLAGAVWLMLVWLVVQAGWQQHRVLHGVPAVARSASTAVAAVQAAPSRNGADAASPASKVGAGATRPGLAHEAGSGLCELLDHALALAVPALARSAEPDRPTVTTRLRAPTGSTSFLPPWWQPGAPPRGPPA